MSAPDGGWVAAGEMGDYTFCPRAHWYARTRGASAPDDARSRAGRTFHDRSLGGVAHRQERAGAYGALAAAAVLLALVGLALWFLVR